MDLLNPPRLDKQSVKKFFNRAAKSYDNAAILQEEVLERLLQRLQYIRHRPRTIADIGCGTGRAVPGLQKAYGGARVIAVDLAHEMALKARERYRWPARKRVVTADMERLPFAGDCVDLVFSSLALQWCNDLDATLAEFARIGRPGALLMFASFGPDTLKELAASWLAIDERHAHVHRFVDMHDVGDAMLRAGFADPVVDAEIIRMEYRSFRRLLDDLREIGASRLRADLGTDPGVRYEGL